MTCTVEVGSVARVLGYFTHWPRKQVYDSANLLVYFYTRLAKDMVCTLTMQPQLIIQS